jgi:RNA polymerase sigma-70 factor (ECF subfamily)
MSGELGDLPAWIRQFTPQLLGVARAFASGDEEAEDLLQELWIIAHESAHRRPTDAPLGAWLHAILLNIGRTRWRRRRRRERLMSLWGPSTSQHDESTVEDDIDGSILRGSLWRDVAALPSLQRQVVLLRIVEDVSTARTAALLSRAEGTVKASLHRALRTLRARLTARTDTSGHA